MNLTPISSPGAWQPTSVPMFFVQSPETALSIGSQKMRSVLVPVSSRPATAQELQD
jgi:hypothetical protein